eukprot:scaffold256062_cov31-Tisochrysis_lutea.AAC.2
MKGMDSSLCEVGAASSRASSAGRRDRWYTESGSPNQNSLTACDELMSATSWSCSAEWRTRRRVPGTLRTLRWPAT